MRIDRSDVPPFLVGIASLPAQAILLRELLARGGGNELSLTLYLAIWLAGSALGARVWGRAAARTRIAPGTILAGGLAIVATSFALARLTPMPGSVAGEPPRPDAILLTGILVLFPAAFFTAGLFPLAARGAASPGRAYAAEAVGAVAGGVGATALAAARVPAATILSFAAAAVFAGRGRRPIFAAAAVILAVFALSGAAARIDGLLFAKAWRDRHPGLRLLAHAATPTRQLALSEREGEVWLLADDAPVEVLNDPYRDDAIAALLLAAAPDARSFLLVGFGGRGVAPALRRAGAGQVLCVLPEREDTLMAPPARGVRFGIGDPRRVLRDLDGRWDVIAVSGGIPTSVAANRLWTEEAFAEMAALASDRGVIVAIAPGGAAAPGPETRAWRASVASALAAAAGNAQAIDADRFVVAASRCSGAASLDADSLARRFARGGWTLPSYPPARFRAEYPRDRIVKLPPAPENRDARPAAFAHALARWFRLSGVAEPPRGALIALVAVLVLLPLVARRGAGVLIATGAASMGLDLLVLMAYQARVGLLPSGMGALLGAFLGGTAIGAWLAGRAGERPRWLAPICLAQGLLAAAAAVLLPRLPGATPLFAAAACLLGVTCGLPFPIVARAGTSARAWAADAAGGIVGALLVLLVIPRGIVATGLVLALLPLLATTRSLGSPAGTPGSGRP